MCSRSPWARKPHTATVTSSLSACAQMEKRGTAPLEGWAADSPSSPFHRGPGDAGRRSGGCQGSCWDKADQEAQDGQFLVIYQGGKLGREATLEDSTFYPLFLVGFSPVPDQKGIFLLQEAEVGSVKQDLNINAHGLERRGLLTGLHPPLW